MTAQDARRRRPGGTVRGAALAALTAVLLAVGLMTAPPAQAVKVGKAGAVWMTRQYVSGGTVALRLEWQRVRKARKYEIDYVATRGSVVSGRALQASASKRTVKVRKRVGAIQTATITGLAPGTTYCFQIRGRYNRRTVGLRGAVHCKVTTRTNRVRPASAFPLVVGTYNVCSAACSTLAPWSTRAPLVRRRVLEMNVGAGGRAVDVLAVQEGNFATGYFEETLPGFTRGCQTVEGTWKDNQSVFVRDSTYEVVPDTSGGIEFEYLGDPSHGACWVKVRELASGQEVVVASVHLLNGNTSAAASTRAKEIAAIQAAVVAAHPDTPVVYAGDFNSTRSHTVDHPLVRLATTGHDDAYDQSLAYLSAPFRNSMAGPTGEVRRSWTWGDHIDRVFAPPGAHVASWEVDYRIASATRYVTPIIADHNPVLVTLLLPVAD